MLTQEQFVQRVMDNFDKIDRNITDLDKKYTNLHEKIAIHLKVEEELEVYKNQLKSDKNSRFYIIMALMAVGFTLYEIGKSFFV